MNQIEPPNFSRYEVKVFSAPDESHFVLLDSRLSGYFFNFLLGWLRTYIEETAGWWATNGECWYVVRDNDDENTLLLIKPSGDVVASNCPDNWVYPLPNSQRSYRQRPTDLGELVAEFTIELDEGDGVNPHNLVTDASKQEMDARVARETNWQIVVLIFCWLAGSGIFGLAVVGFIYFMAWLLK